MMRPWKLTKRRLVAPAAPAAAIDPMEQLQRLVELREQGVLSEDEFSAEKQKILAR
jgi:Short C-terminal domain